MLSIGTCQFCESGMLLSAICWPSSEKRNEMTNQHKMYKKGLNKKKINLWEPFFNNINVTWPFG